MAGTAVGGILAFIGGISFVIIAVVSVFFQKRLSDEDLLTASGPGLPTGICKLPKQTYTEAEAAEAHKTGTPGTIVLVVIFFVCFILYYFANWKILATLWKVG
jgi:hypothetical protein